MSIAFPSAVVLFRFRGDPSAYCTSRGMSSQTTNTPWNLHLPPSSEDYKMQSADWYSNASVASVDAVHACPDKSISNTDIPELAEATDSSASRGHLAATLWFPPLTS